MGGSDRCDGGAMTEQAIFRLVVYGLWLPVFSLTAIYFSFRWIESQRRARREWEISGRREDSSRRADYEISRFQAEFRDSADLLRKYVESSLEDIGPRISRSVEEALAQPLEKLSAPRSGPVAVQPAEAPANSDRLIREVSHALNTPLSHIEAALITLDTEARRSGRTDLQDRLNTVLTSVQMCKSIIASFREAILSTKATTAWSPTSLSAAVASAAQMLADAESRNLVVEVNLPEMINGFSNNYVVGLLLPLIENAIDSARPGTAVSISARDTGYTTQIDVSSTPDTLPASNEIYVDGFTTKPGHNGTGLSIVQHLLSTRPGAQLSHNVAGRSIVFTIKLPLITPTREGDHVQ